MAGVLALLALFATDALAQSTTSGSIAGDSVDGFSKRPFLRTQAVTPKRMRSSGQTSADGTLPDREKLNGSTVTVVTAPVGGVVSAMGSDMANVLDDGDRLRVLPILGKGSVQNLVDVLRLKSVDMGFVMSDAIEFVKTEYAVPNLEDRVRYIAEMFYIDVHIVARTEIRTIRDLEGKKIFAERNFGYYTVRNIFNRLNIKADIDYKTDIAGGLQKVLDGGADAWIGDVGKIGPIIRNIKNDGGKLHLVAIPYDPAIQDLYLPSTFKSTEYPNLVAPEETVETVAAPILLMVYNWPEGSDRYNRVAKFVDALFSRLSELQKPPRNPKWLDVNIAATVPRLKKFKAAEEWLTLRSDFERAAKINSRTSIGPAPAPSQVDQFLEWRRTRKP